MAQNNRLDITIGANYQDLLKSFRTIEAEAKKSSASVSTALQGGGAGAEALGQAVGKAAGSFSELGDKAKKEFDDVEKAAKVAGSKTEGAFDGVDTEQLRNEIERLKKEFADMAAKSAQEIQGLNQTIGKLEDQLKKTNDSAKTRDIAQFAEKLAGDLEGVGSSFREAGDEARDLERKIALAFSKPDDVKKYTALAKDLKREFQGLVDADELALGIQRAGTLGVASEKNLRRFINIAKATGKGIDDVADDFGEFLADVNSGVVDPGVLETIRANFGIGAKELEKFGAKLDVNGQLLARNRAEIKLAQDAILAYVDSNERFANVAQRAQDSQSKLQGEIDKFNTSVGEANNELSNYVATALLPFAEALNKNVSSGLKAFLAGSTTAIGGAASLGLKMVELGAYAKLAGVPMEALGARLVKLRAATTAFAAANGVMIAGLGLVAAGIVAITYSGNEYIKTLENIAKAEGSLADTQSKILAQNKERARLINKSVADIKKEADTYDSATKQKIAITDAILAKEVAYSKARDEGNDKAAAGYKLDIQELRKLRNEYAGDEAFVLKAEKSKEQARVQSAEAGREAFRSFKDELSKGFFDSDKDALKKLESITGALDPETLKEAKVERKKLQQSILADELDALKSSVDARKKSTEDGKKQFDELLSKYEVNTGEREKLERDFTSFLEDQGDKRLKAEEDVQKKKLDIQRAGLALQKQAIDSEIDALQKKFAAGENVEGQLAKEIEKRGQNVAKILEEQAALDKLQAKKEAAAETRDNPDQAAGIAKNLAAQQKQIDAQLAQDKLDNERKVAEEIRSFREQAAKRAADFEAQTAKVRLETLDAEKAKQQEIFDQRRRALDEEEARGQDVAQKRLDLEKEIIAEQENSTQKRLALATAEIQARLKQQNIGASKEQQSLNNEQAKLDILKAQQTARQDLQTIVDGELSKEKAKTAEIQAQLQALKDQGDEKKKQQGFDTKLGTVSGIENINDNTGGFGEKRKAKEDSGPTEAQLKKQLTRQQIKEIEAKEKAKKALGDTKPEISAQTSQVNQAERDRIAASKQAKEAANSIGAGQIPAASPIDSGALLQVNTQTNQLLTTLITGVQNLTAATKQQSSTTPKTDNFADRRLARRSENTLEF